MNKNLAIITNTNSVNSDLWTCHFEQCHKYLPIKHYAFSDIKVPDDSVETLIYSTEEKFRTQFLSCIAKISEEFCLYLNEDYLL